MNFGNSDAGAIQSSGQIVVAGFYSSSNEVFGVAIHLVGKIVAAGSALQIGVKNCPA